MGCTVSVRDHPSTLDYSTVSKPAKARSPGSIRQAFLDGRLNLDPRCPLDARQLYGLTKSWKAISRNMTITAINMFARYEDIWRSMVGRGSG